MTDRWETFNQFEEMGEAQVRGKVDSGEYNRHPLKALAIEWLDNREADRADAYEERKKLKVQIAEEANRIAKRANRFSVWALIISLLAIVVAIVT